MYAVVKTGGKQYKVAPGQKMQVETLEGDKGSSVVLGRVVAIVDGGTVKAGAAVANATVTGTIDGHDRDKKTLVFKFKRKKQYKRTIGHRQNHTAVTVKEISA